MPELEVDHEASFKLKEEFKRLTVSQFKQEKDIHVTNLLWCLEKAARRIDNPQEEKPNRYMVEGTLAHLDLEPIIGALFGEGKVVTREKKIRWRGIVGTIDLMIDGIPYEIKTNATGRVNDTYLEQLSSYLIFTQAPYGKLVVRWLPRDFNTTDTEYHIDVYTYRPLREHLDEWVNTLTFRRDTVKASIRTGEHVPLEDINRKFFECGSCIYAKLGCPYAIKGRY